MGSRIWSAWQRWIGFVVGSLERRLAGALVLILAGTACLQFVSHDQAFHLRADSQILREATTSAEKGEQLVKAVSQFRLAARLAQAPNAGASHAEDELADAAIKIGEAVNALRLSGSYGLENPETTALFSDLDRLDGAILAAAGQSPEQSRWVDQRNAAMGAAAEAILRRADMARDQAAERFDASVQRWQQIVLAVGVLTILLAMLILADLLHNTLPAMRRMHDALRRLASGDLDVPLEDFRLHELAALSGPLEIFRRHAQAVRDLAFTDHATRLPNRRAFMERTATLLAAGPVGGYSGFVIAVGDVDRFKHVNDDYGHAIGDRLIAEIANRLQTEIGPDVLVARIGGDEFALCLPLSDHASAATLARQVLGTLRQPFDCGTFSVTVTMSLGYTETPGGPRRCDITELLDHADLALQAAKRGGRNRAAPFVETLAEERSVRRAMEFDLADALARGDLRMVYQPVHRLTGADSHPPGDEVEALLRWRHPTLGEIPPERFINAAERSGQMDHLGRWIVERAIADLADWPALVMSINLSPLQLKQDGFVGVLIGCCRKHGISTSRLILEITESLPIEGDEQALMTLGLLRASGFRIALDDFGTGYSSLCMMKSVQFDRLKLDRSLVSDLCQDASARAVFEAAVTMALKLGCEVVAEGVSEAAMLEPVRAAGCTHVQGYLFSRPLEVEAVAGYFAGSSPVEALRAAG